MVILRPFVPEDAAALQHVYSGASIRFTTGSALTYSQAQQKIRSALAETDESPRTRWSWGIVADNVLVGKIALRRRSCRTGTLRYILCEAAWGHGYATEATERAATFAFTVVRFDRLEAEHHPANPASGRVLTKAGFRYVGTSERCMGGGAVLPYPTYVLLRM
ncbi:GNAT family N-acetyltransferase [Streptomyces chumphonensis]|uniref:GNAT family N-acetyltransferase n=1 Tax=Streptomyces chumphonensis TaxID=1214925 RepID=UPI003D720E97